MTKSIVTHLDNFSHQRLWRNLKFPPGLILPNCQILWHCHGKLEAQKRKCDASWGSSLRYQMAMFKEVTVHHICLLSSLKQPCYLQSVVLSLIFHVTSFDPNLLGSLQPKDLLQLANWNLPTWQQPLHDSIDLKIEVWGNQRNWAMDYPNNTSKQNPGSRTLVTRWSWAPIFWEILGNSCAMLLLEFPPNCHCEHHENYILRTWCSKTIYTKHSCPVLIVFPQCKLSWNRNFTSWLCSLLSDL